MHLLLGGFLPSLPIFITNIAFKTMHIPLLATADMLQEHLTNILLSKYSK